MKMKRITILLSVLAGLSMLLSACGGAPPTAAPATEAPATKAPATEAPAATAAPAEEGTLPRNETLYFNGFQWGAIKGWNPYSSDMNNAMAVVDGANNASARVTMFETPYMYNMIDGKQYPLLADGDYAWQDRGHLQDQSCRKVERWYSGDR
jgi:peptide/nickel transport system substrate-binding protein